jgi:hypothetical protein
MFTLICRILLDNCNIFYETKKAVIKKSPERLCSPRHFQASFIKHFLNHELPNFYLFDRYKYFPILLLNFSIHCKKG